jgi:HEAT repeat protein
LLLQFAANTNIWVRYRAVVSLGAIHADPERVMPVLINALHDPNENIQNVAVQSLGQFGRHAEPAVPALIAFINAPNTDVVDKMNATNVLKQIDREAASKAGVK